MTLPKGPKGEKRPADVVGAAVMAAKIATGEVEDAVDDDGWRVGHFARCGVDRFADRFAGTEAGFARALQEEAYHDLISAETLLPPR